MPCGHGVDGAMVKMSFIDWRMAEEISRRWRKLKEN